MYSLLCQLKHVESVKVLTQLKADLLVLSEGKKYSDTDQQETQYLHGN